MPNKPRQEKRICAQCGIRTRRWVQSAEDGTTTCHACADMIIGMTKETPQAAQEDPEHALADSFPAQAPNVPVEGAGEERRMPQYGESPTKTVRITPIIRTHEVKLGAVEQEFDIQLTPYEINAKGAQLSGAVNEIAQIEAEKMRAKREFGARLKAARQNMNRLAQAVATGTVAEVRKAEVWLDRDQQRVNYRAPVTGILYASRAVEPGEQLHLPMEGET